MSGTQLRSRTGINTTPTSPVRLGQGACTSPSTVGFPGSAFTHAAGGQDGSFNRLRVLRATIRSMGHRIHKPLREPVVEVLGTESAARQAAEQLWLGAAVLLHSPTDFQPAVS